MDVADQVTECFTTLYVVQVANRNKDGHDIDHCESQLPCKLHPDSKRIPSNDETHSIEDCNPHRWCNQHADHKLKFDNKVVHQVEECNRHWWCKWHSKPNNIRFHPSEDCDPEKWCKWHSGNTRRLGNIKIKFCGTCLKTGHTPSTCETFPCDHCGDADHCGKNCDIPFVEQGQVFCTGCWAEDHFMEVCPKLIAAENRTYDPDRDTYCPKCEGDHFKQDCQATQIKV